MTKEEIIKAVSRARLDKALRKPVIIYSLILLMAMVLTLALFGDNDAAIMLIAALLFSISVIYVGKLEKRTKDEIGPQVTKEVEELLKT